MNFSQDPPPFKSFWGQTLEPCIPAKVKEEEEEMCAALSAHPVKKADT